jgi:hypothetical protein
VTETTFSTVSESTVSTVTASTEAYPLCEEPEDAFDDNDNYDVEGIRGNTDALWKQDDEDLSCRLRIPQEDDTILIVPVFADNDLNNRFDLTELRFTVRGVSAVVIVFKKGRRSPSIRVRHSNN